jgi:RimJ/RimL family protein N-acetyltransferase
MATLEDIFPILGLRVAAGDLELRGIDDATLPALGALAVDGVVPEGRPMPFFVSWTEAPPEELPANVARYHWSTRAEATPDRWTIELAVRVAGELVGVQSVHTSHFRTLRIGETGSWLGRRYQGRGIGTRMRQAMAALCFDHLGFEEVMSQAYDDNPASQRVSAKVGFTDNGMLRKARQDGWQYSRSFRLTPDTFVRGVPIEVTGAAAVRRFLGIDEPPTQ